MLVTDIRRLDDKRFCLYVDYEPFAPMYASDIRRLGAEVDGEIDEEQLQTFRKEHLYGRALNKAVRSIEFSDKCEYDIRQKLKNLCYDGEIIEYVVEKLMSYGYIDDLRYASGYIRRRSGKKGIKAIRRELEQKQISRHVIEEAIEGCELPDEKETIKGILLKRYSQRDFAEKKQKILSYMYGKGFGTDTVNTCIRELSDDVNLEILGG